MRYTVIASDNARTDWTKARMIFIIFYNNKNVQLSGMGAET